jgi:CcmD family protein
MSSKSFLTALILCVVALSSTSAWSQEPVKPVVQFAEPATQATDSTDPKQLLAACDNRVEVCERDAIGVPFLAAAYMAIWVILIAFLIIIRRGQRRLELELKELERRLDSPGGSSA